MKAVQIHSYGGPETLTYEDIPRPEPTEDELLAEANKAHTLSEKGHTRGKIVLQVKT